MPSTQHIAQHFHQVYFGGNWTVTNLKDTIADVDLQTALHQVQDLNNIATLTFHIHYFIKVASRVLEGYPLEGNDKLSFNHPPFDSEEAWGNFKIEVLDKGKKFAELIDALEDSILEKPFGDEKYGSYQRNLLGIIEHTHYHLGQISLIKKLLS